MSNVICKILQWQSSPNFEVRILDVTLLVMFFKNRVNQSNVMDNVKYASKELIRYSIYLQIVMNLIWSCERVISQLKNYHTGKNKTIISYNTILYIVWPSGRGQRVSARKHNSLANALELHLTCTNLSMWHRSYWKSQKTTNILPLWMSLVLSIMIFWRQLKIW